MLRPLTLLAALLPLCSAQLNLEAKKAGLKYFGTATDTPGQRERAGFEVDYPQYDAILDDINEFGQTTAANGQKWIFIEPEQGVFNFTEGDIVTAIAQENGMIQRCHTLVWHSQLAPWVEAQNWTADAMRDIIVTHVTHVMEHYKGKCYAWDVVNEALNEDGTYRDSPFSRALGGDEFIKLAFATAQRVEPAVKLYYNDYNIEKPGNKSSAVLRIVGMLKGAGIKIDGVGLQSHFTAGLAPTIDQQISIMDSYTALGVEVALTELDVRIQLPLNDTNIAWQTDGYKASVGACVQVKKCVGVTLWDFYDPFSWVPAVFPGQGDALLWFEDFTKHPAYYGVIDALKNATGGHGCKPKPYGRRSAKVARSNRLH